MLAPNLVRSALRPESPLGSRASNYKQMGNETTIMRWGSLMPIMRQAGETFVVVLFTVSFPPFLIAVVACKMLGSGNLQEIKLTKLFIYSSNIS